MKILHFKSTMRLEEGGVVKVVLDLCVMSQGGNQVGIAGTGDEPYVQQMKQLAISEGTAGHTYFLGFATGKQKIALLAACDVFALPTSQENFGFVFFEALASATFVVTTKGTDTWPEIQKSKGGSIVDNTPETFAKELGHILQNIPEYQARADQGRQWVFSEMDKDTIQQKYEHLYQSVIKSNESNQ